MKLSIGQPLYNTTYAPVTVGGSIREKEDEVGTNTPVTEEGMGTVRGMREGDDGRIVGVPQGETSWAGGRGAMELGSLGYGRRISDLSDGLPEQGRAA